jgi:hypothetical protein
MAIIHLDDSMTRVGIFILLNNSHHYTLIEECTILFIRSSYVYKIL